MKKTVLFILLITLFLLSCDKNNTTEITSGTTSGDNKSARSISPDINPRKSLEEIGFWNKQYFSLEYNPLYGYCYQHLFPEMDTSQEKDVIAFHVTSLIDPMVIFVMDKVSYNNGQYELSGKIDNKPAILYLKLLNDNTINVMLGDYGINESFDLPSGISYSSFTDNTYNHEEEPLFDLTAYDTCEDLDRKIIADISDRLTDESVQEIDGTNAKTDKGYDCWGKWSNINDLKNVYYELDKKNMLFKDYTEVIYKNSDNVTVSNIDNMTYKNGIFYFNFDDREMMGHMVY